MNIDDFTIKQARELAALFSSQTPNSASIDSGMIGKYVIVRCRDAGVHAGVLQAHNGREALLTDARRLWYWKPADGKKFLSGVAVAGLHADSKIGVAVSRIMLTEDCEIIECSQVAEKSIREAKDDE